MRRVAVTIVLLTSLLANAQQIYTWKDSAGVEHFTDDPTQVPKNARKTQGAAILTVPSEHPAQEQQQAPDTSAQPAPEDYPAWQAKFREARSTIEQLKKLIAADQQIVSPGGLPVTGSYSCYSGNYNVATGQRGDAPCGFMQPDAAFEQAKQRLEYNRNALVIWQNYLQDLERAASSAGVPQKWRQ